jgi:hypothetical protein
MGFVSSSLLRQHLLTCWFLVYLCAGTSGQTSVGVRVRTPIWSRPGCLFGSQAGWCYSFFGTLNGRMIEQEFIEDGGSM